MPPLQTEPPPVWRIGAWTLHPARDELELQGRRIKLEPRLTQVPLSLCAAAGEVVSNQTLHDTVWGRVQVTPGSIYEAIARLRQVLATDGSTPAYIATVPRRGYRLVAPVALANPTEKDGPRLAVLPFRSAGLDPRLAALRERLLEGLIASLSRHTLCKVMAHGSVLALADQVDALARLTRVFGARYVVDGSLVSRGHAIVIRVELIDAPRQELLWTESVETAPQDGPELSGPVVERLARALNLQLMAALAKTRSLGLADARRLAMGSWVELFCRPQSEATNQRAWDMSQQALGQDHDEALGRVTRAYAGWRAANYGWQGLERDSTMAAALADAERAIALQPQMHDAYFTLSLLSAAHGEHARAEEALRHSLRLVPDLATAWGLLGSIRAIRGHPEDTEALIRKALDLSPCEPLRATWYWHLARSALDLGEPERALEAAQQAMAANPELAGGYLCGVMAAQLLGHRDLATRWLAWIQARPRYATAERLRATSPRHSPANLRHGEQMVELLRAAGLPES